jgi:hypothetical protein
MSKSLNVGQGLMYVFKNLILPEVFAIPLSIIPGLIVGYKLATKTRKYVEESKAFPFLSHRLSSDVVIFIVSGCVSYVIMAPIHRSLLKLFNYH